MSSESPHFEHQSPVRRGDLNVATLIAAYETSFFPMAMGDQGEFWFSPDPRAVIPLDDVRISRSLRKTVESGEFEVRLDTSFHDVIMSCSRRHLDDPWISDEIVQAYHTLHEQGAAHCVETWKDGELVGGLYGVTRGAAFFGESMFSKVSNASKVAFVALTRHLKERDYLLLDTQYINPFTKQLGAIEIPRQQYLTLLQNALSRTCIFKTLS